MPFTTTTLHAGGKGDEEGMRAYKKSPGTCGWLSSEGRVEGGGGEVLREEGAWPEHQEYYVIYLHNQRHKMDNQKETIRMTNTRVHSNEWSLNSHGKTNSKFCRWTNLLMKETELHSTLVQCTIMQKVKYDHYAAAEL